VRIMTLATSVVCTLCALPAQGDPYSRTGWTAELETYYHGVSGLATIVDADTFRVDDFTYDGGGPAVYFYLGTEQSDQAFYEGLGVGPLLTATIYDHDSLVIDLDGTTLDGYNALSVWCEDFNVDFGSGTFVPSLLLGDVNTDGDVNGLDVDPFVVLVTSGGYQAEADMNEDLAVNGLDVDPFVAAVVGGTQPIPEPSTLPLALIALGVVGGWRKWCG
jgi:hypothetical protein